MNGATLAPPQQAPGKTAEVPPTPAAPAPAPAPGPPTPLAAAMATPARPSGAPAKGPGKDLDADAPAEETVLVGGQPFQPSEAVRQYLEAKGSKGARVNVRFGNVAAGPMHVVKTGEGYATRDGGAEGLPLTLALLSPLQGLPLRPVLAVTLKGGVMGGYATVGGKGGQPLERGAFLDALEEHAEALGWLGLNKPRLPLAENKVEGDKLIVTSAHVSFKVGGFLTASGSFGIENQAVTFVATATGSVNGLATITLDVKRGPDGVLTGTGEVPLELKGFSGVLKVAFGRGLVDVEGTVKYANEKFAGELTIVATDQESASALVASKTPQPPPAAGAGPASTGAPAPVGAVEAAPAVPAPPTQLVGPKPGPRVIAGWGTVKVQLADWLSGDALVVVSPTGKVKVVGKITPKMDKPLFEQRDYIRPLPKVEVRALYGVPLVGNVFLFANIGLEALAKIGPATLDRMEIVGTYSTDPKDLQNFTLTGTLNISAFAGLRIKAEGGVGVEIIDHDIKAGAAVTALAGIRGYVDATPTIGYREIADPAAGKKGEFFIAGDLQIAAQPFLGLGGELFVELDSPWWSPAPDDRWNWPLGQLEYPLPGEFGIGAHVEHVLGSGKVPELEFKEVEFNSDRFMTDLLNDKVPPKKAGEQEKKGTWDEKKSDAPAPPAADGPKSAPAVTGSKPSEPAKGATGQQAADAGQPPNLANEKRWAAGMKALGELAEKSKGDPQDPTEINKALATIKKEHGFKELRPVLNGNLWDIHAAMNSETGKTGGTTKKAQGHESVINVAADSGAAADLAKKSAHYAEMDLDTLRALAVADREAAWALVSRLERMTTPELRALAGKDPTAKQVLANRPSAFAKSPEDPQSTAELAKQVHAARAALPKEAAGVLAVATTDLPLDQKTFRGASPRARVEALSTPQEIKTPSKHGHAQSHAEEVVGNEILAAVKRAIAQGAIDADSATGRIEIHVEQEVCPVCRQGLDSRVAAGVLAQLSRRLPKVVIQVTAKGTSETIHIVNGRRIF